MGYCGPKEFGGGVGYFATDISPLRVLHARLMFKTSNRFDKFFTTNKVFWLLYVLVDLCVSAGHLKSFGVIKIIVFKVNSYNEP